MGKLDRVAGLNARRLRTNALDMRRFRSLRPAERGWVLVLLCVSGCAGASRAERIAEVAVYYSERGGGDPACIADALDDLSDDGIEVRLRAFRGERVNAVESKDEDRVFLRRLERCVEQAEATSSDQ